MRTHPTARRALTGVALALALSAVGWYLAGARGSAPRPPTSLLLVSIDTLRADRLSLYGYARPTSPNLDALSREAVVFDRFFYNGGGTLPSHMSLMTSLHPATHGVGPESGKALEPERWTLAEILQGRGFATAAFTDGGWMSAKFGFGQGFERYDEAGHGFAETLPRALAWLDQLPAGRPFFLFLHSYDVHSAWRELPYDCPGDAELRFAGPPPPEVSGCRDGACASARLAEANRRVRAGEPLDARVSPAEVAYFSDLYDGCVAFADARLGDLFARLRAAGRWEETLVVVLSDHGEEFGEHGQLLHDQGGYEELARIPLLIKLPHGRFGGRRIESLAAMVDVLPTLTALLGAPTPAEAQGRSLVRALESGRTGRPDVHMYSVLRDERQKYFSDERRLFDLDADPRERANLYGASPERVGALERRVRDLIALDHAAADRFARRAHPGARPAMSDEEIERLRALGYLR